MTMPEVPAEPTGGPTELLDLRTTRGRLTLATVTLGSGVALLDSTVVNIALPTIGRDLGSSLGGLQWVINGFTLSLASLILVGGSLSDRFGRRRVYVIGVAWFGIASLLCALSPTIELLIIARVLQGIGGALLTPGGLAIIQSSFRPEDRSSAIGTWAGVSGIAVAIGPLLGGVVVANLGWPWIFLINLPLCALVIGLAIAAVPESKDVEAARAFDFAGALTATLMLALLTWLLTNAAIADRPLVVGGSVVAVAAMVVFVLAERRASYPLVPLTLFSSRVFSAANLMTLLVYGALGWVMFALVLQLQTTSGFTPLESGIATLPVPLILLLASTRMAVLAERTGPRIPMTVGPLVCAGGVLVLSAVGEDSGWVLVLGGMIVFGIGLSTLVAPLTATVLAAAPDRLAGSASGINNAVARTGSLLAVAAIPALVGLTGDDYRDPVALTAGYVRASFITAGLLAAGGLVSWFGLGRTVASRVPN